jgi:hypothetical protein
MLSQKNRLPAANSMGSDEISFDVFFSYQRRDNGPVEAVARTLTERGLRVFLDRWYLNAWTAMAAGPGAHARIL